jgi:P-type Cu+ transporter
MSTIPILVSRKTLWTSLLLTVTIWIATGRLQWPETLMIPVYWQAILSVMLTLLLFAFPARNHLKALFYLRRNDIPALFAGCAAILTSLPGFYHVIDAMVHHRDPVLGQVHFHSTAFIVTIDLVIRRLLEGDQERRYEEIDSDRSLTPSIRAHLFSAIKDKAPFVERAHTVSYYVYGAVIILCLITLITWATAGQSVQGGIIQIAAILACVSPWVWMYGIPNTFNLAVFAAIKEKALVESVATFDKTNQINGLIFGKRGVLTHGQPRVTDIIPMTGIDEEELLLWAASSEADSKHPFGRAVVSEAEKQAIPLEPVERFIEVTGRGVECVIDGQSVRLGKTNFFDAKTFPAYLADRVEALAKAEGKTPFICKRGQQYLGIIAIAEELRPEAASVLEIFRQMHIQIILLTGDDRMMSEAIAEPLHIDQVLAEVSTNQKARQIRQLRSKGIKVGTLGRYPEDQAAFEASDLSISLSRGERTEMLPVDVVLLEDKLTYAQRFFSLSRRIRRIARENNLFGLFYHGATTIMAAGLLVPFGFRPFAPVTAAFLSFAAILIVILNNRRILA